MSETLRRIEIPIAITIFCCILQIVPFYISVKPLETFSDTFRSWMVLVATCALFLGATSLALLHSKNVQRKSKGWQFSVLTIISMIVMMLAGLPISEIGLGDKNPVFDFLFKNVLTPLGATMYSIIAFFITSAAYRSFRARSVEAAIVLAAGILMICYNAPLMNVSFPPFIPIGDWIFSIPNMATMRAVIIGAALGAIALAMRVLLGIERGYLRGGED